MIFLLFLMLHGISVPCNHLLSTVRDREYFDHLVETNFSSDCHNSSVIITGNEHLPYASKTLPHRNLVIACNFDLFTETQFLHLITLLSNFLKHFFIVLGITGPK